MNKSDEDAMVTAVGRLLRDLQQQIDRLAEAHKDMVIQVGALERQLDLVKAATSAQSSTLAQRPTLHAVHAVNK